MLMTSNDDKGRFFEKYIEEIKVKFNYYVT